MQGRGAGGQVRPDRDPAAGRQDGGVRRVRSGPHRRRQPVRRCPHLVPAPLLSLSSPAPAPSPFPLLSVSRSAVAVTVEGARAGATGGAGS
eukprot:955852-Rhodomonas_salina.1